MLTSNTMLNRSGESGHPCLVPDISGKAFSFCPLSMILAVDLSYIASQCLLSQTVLRGHCNQNSLVLA